MYKNFIRPLLFRMRPEFAHKVTFSGLKVLQQSGLTGILSPKTGNELSRTVMGLTFPNPVGVAAGLDKNAEVVKAFPALGFGFAEIGTVTPLGQPGNDRPRLFRLKKDQALINRMGFNNEGADAVAARLKRKRPANFIIGGNIGKNTATPNEEAVEDYTYVFHKLFPVVDYFVVNVSCPNITNMKELQDKDSLQRILDAVLAARNHYEHFKPVLLKLSPDLNREQTADSIKIAQNTGIDGLVIANTTVSRENLLENQERIAQIGSGGLSGKPVARRSTEMIRLVHQETRGSLPIIGVGGIFSAADAIGKLEAGASLIQLYTGYIYEGPALVRNIKKQLASQ